MFMYIYNKTKDHHPLQTQTDYNLAKYDYWGWNHQNAIGLKMSY